jgi:peptidyl-prolyl cis-trans isomerase D
MNRLLYFVLFVLSISVSASAQTAFPDSVAATQEEARIWAEIRKPYFKTTVDDSMFVINNSEFPFRYDYYTRAELAGLMEQMFFNAREGDVVGPLFLEGYAMLYKVISFDSTYRMKASHVFIKPEGTTKKDTANALKKANKVLKEINKGLAFADAAKKYGQDEVAKNGGDMGWFGEGMMVKEFEQAVMKGKQGDVFVLQTPFGAHVIKITEDKVKEPKGRVKVVPLLKKI